MKGASAEISRNDSLREPTATRELEKTREDFLQATNAPIPGFSPHQRTEIDALVLDIGEEARGERIKAESWSAPVRTLDHLLRRDPILGMYASEMLDQVPSPHRAVASIPQLLTALQLLSTRAPAFHTDPGRANFFPASALFVHMMMTPAGQALFRMEAFNDCLRSILKSWCHYLDSPQSRNVLHTGETGWLSAPSRVRNNLHEYLVPDNSSPHWGFVSFNAFFHRQINREFRPIAEPGNARVIASPNDGTLYKVTHDTKSTDRFWVKGQPYALKHMLAGNPLSQRFQGGIVYQSFLDGSNYHRFWSPIAGTVRDVVSIEGLMFSNAESAGADLTAGTYSQAYMTCVNTRSLVPKESDDPTVGMVCLMAIGISEISSITISAPVGQLLAKGDEIGHFSYGGSSICLLFQPGVIRDFAINVRDTGAATGTRGVPLKAGQCIAYR
jgi:phosphatidylserine decarboxylase